MRKNQIFLLIGILIGLLLLFVNQGQLDRYRSARQAQASLSGAQLPATLSITTFALGPLRSLIVDALWWRAIRQQADGQFFDALQLADWITRLQPEFPSIWAFQGWNMAYNIAAEFGSEKERWKWILRGISLLRDEGLRYNPGNPVIRHELGRIFFDRIGGVNDPGAEYFKNQWAFLMMKYFETGDRHELERLARTPKTKAELRRIPGLAAYLDAALKMGTDVLDFAKNVPTKQGVAVPGLSTKARNLAANEVYWFYRRQRIEQDLKLDPDRLLFIDRQYGPLDWRLHQAHAIYWTAEMDFKNFITQSLNYAQVIRQSMISSFYEGKLFHNQRLNVITRTSNLKIIARIHDYLEYLMEHTDHPSPAIIQAHQDFVKRAIAILYSFNQITKARELYHHLIETRPEDGSPNGFKGFVLDSLAYSMKKKNARSQRAMIAATIRQSLDKVAIGEYDHANGILNLARLMWNQYQKHFKLDPAKRLPPFEQMVQTGRLQYMKEKKLNANEFERQFRAARSHLPEQIDTGAHEHEHHSEKEPDVEQPPESPAHHD